MAKKRTTKKRTTKKTAGKAASGGSAAGKKLVIVESPAKAKTINRYLGPDYVVKASVGHVRDLPAKAKKGEKVPVPGVDLENDFEPTYVVLQGKTKTVNELKRAARGASEVWFATDLDREGEAIAWHLAQLLGIPTDQSRRVVFNAITKSEIERAFDHPHAINEDRVNAQQARRILDRIVGYQVSPLLWKKVARGLSAGRVQSVAVRLVVDREREIRAYIPDESWQIAARFTTDPAAAGGLADDWAAFMGRVDEKGKGPTLKAQNAWLADRQSLRAELVSIGDASFAVTQPGDADAEPRDLTADVAEIARLAGLTSIETTVEEDESGKGPARFRRTITGEVDVSTAYTVSSIETRRTRSKPAPPFITSTLQQAASSRLGFAARRTMSTAQRLYEGIELPGEGAVGLITYMRTDSTHLTTEAVDAARLYIDKTYGGDYLPEAPRRYTSSNTSAQEAHEAIRPTSLDYPPDRVASALTSDQLRLYTLIWNRFLACQMTDARWDSTTVLITGGTDPSRPVTFKANGRVLIFDGFYRVAGVPVSSDEQTLPSLEERHAMAPFHIEPIQRFGSPPPRYTEASLIKTLEAEGIGRPSTYASIIGVIQDRNYVELLDRRFHATDLGEVVTDKLMEAFPKDGLCRFMELDYTKRMEAELDRIEDEHTDWISVLRDFYGRFEQQLDRAHEDLVHAKAETTPAPFECEKCGAPTCYRFGKNGRFLSCTRYPKCDYACPIDREGNPKPVEVTEVACHLCGAPMIKRSGRFGPFLGCSAYPECNGILKLDNQGRPLAPAVPPLLTDIQCPKCEDAELNLRSGARGPWLSCSNFPKCRGRGKWSELTEQQKAAWTTALEAHEREHPIPIIRDLDGNPLTDEKGKPLPQDEEGVPAGDLAYDQVA